MPPTLVSLDVADRPELWADLGFAVTGDSCTIGAVEHRLGAPGSGLVGWAFTDADLDGEDLDGIATAVDEAPERHPAEHPNGATSVDHVVLMTPNLARTVAALGDAGFELRRVRRTGSADEPIEQAFYRVGEAVLEVVGRADTTGDGPARLWGLAFTVADLDATVASLGDRCRPPKPAVQPGRRIATLDRAAGSSVAIAFMSPDERDER